MIRNIFIIKDGVPLIKLHFGECHSLGSNEELLTGFLCALQNFSKELTGSTIKSINLEEYNFYFYKDERRPDLLHVFISDGGEDPSDINFKIQKIAGIFTSKYDSTLEAFDGEVSQFDDFKQVLLDMNLARKNCGGHEECEGCPNNTKTLKFLNTFQTNRTGFLSWLRKVFKKNRS